MGGQHSYVRTCCVRLKENFSSSLPKNNANHQKIETLDTLNLARDKTQINYNTSINADQNFLNYTYQLGEILSEGPHGMVYEALCLENGKMVAAKKISCLSEYRKKIYLYLEGKLMKLTHENLLSFIDIYQSSENQTDLFLVSPLVSGCPLKEALINFHSFDEKIVRIFCKEILQGLIYLENQGLYHSNLKPNNIMIEANGHIKLSDYFTISKKLLSKSPDLSSTGDFQYKSPEILLQQRKGIKADIWAMGCIAIEMLSNDNKFWPNNLKEIIEKIKSKETPIIPENIGKNCQNFLKNCVEIDEAKRLGPKTLLQHEFIHNSKSNEEKEKMLIKGLSLYGSPLKRKGLYKKSKSLGKNLPENSKPIQIKIQNETKNEGNEEKILIGGNPMEKSIEIRKKNELERKKIEEELLAMFNVAE